MEAITLKATLRKQKQQKEQQDAAARKRWQGESGVKSVTAKEPEGGW
jgi:hypothetical protein